MLRLTTILLFLSFFACFPSKAQGNKVDSLLEVLHNSSGILKVKTFNALANEVQRTDVQKALSYGQQALVLSQYLGDKTLIAESKYQVGQANFQAGNYPEALVSYTESFKLFKRQQAEKQAANCLNAIGIMYVRQGSDENSLQYDEALNYFQQALEIRKKLDLQKDIAFSYNSIAVVYKRQKKFEKALEYYYKSLAIFEKLELKRPIAIRLNNISALLSEQGEYEKGLEYYFRAYMVLDELEDDESTTIILNNIAYNYQQLKQYKKAIKYSNHSLNQAKKIGAVDDIKEAYFTLSEIYSEQKDFEKAYLFHQKYTNLKDSLFSVHNNEVLSGLHKRFELEKKDKENELLKAENETHTLQNTVLITLVFAAIIVLTFGLISILKIKKKNKLLARQNIQIVHQNEELGELNEEKNNIISVISHDLRNSLNKIFGFVYLMDYGDSQVSEEQQEYLTQMKLVNEEMASMINNILDIRSIEESGLEIKSEIVPLDEFMNRTLLGHKIQAQRKKISVLYESDFPNDEVLIDKQSLSRILDNLLSNAVKFSAFGKIVILSVTQRGKMLRMKVIDQGPGLTKEDKKNLFTRFKKLSALPTDGESSTGLGLTIVKSLVEQIDGTITIESVLGKGTTFIVEIPSGVENFPKKEKM